MSNQTNLGTIINAKGLNVLLRESDGITRLYPVKRSTGYDEGFVHHYKRKGKEQYVATLQGYKIENFTGKNCIGQIEGHIPAVPLLGNPDFDSPGENYALLLRTHLLAEEAKQIRGGTEIPLKWIIIIVAIIAVGFIGYQFIKPKPEPTQAPIQETTPQTMELKYARLT